MNTRLDDAIKGALADIVATAKVADDDPDRSRYPTAPFEPTVHPTWRRLLVTAAALAVLGATTATLVERQVRSGSDPERIRVADGTEASPPAVPSTTDAPTTSPAPPVATCGSSLPAAFTLLDAGTVAPAPTTNVAPDGQLVAVTNTGALRLELTWPAPSQPLYANGTESAPTGVGTTTTQGTTSSISFTGRPSGPTVEVAVADDAQAMDGPCGLVGVTLVDGTTTFGSFAWRLGPPPADGPAPAIGPIVALDPLIRRSDHVASAPDDANPCQGPGGGPNRSGDGAPSPAPSAAQALDEFLSTETATTLYQSGYLEMVVSPERVVYGAPLEIGPGTFDETRFVTLITVERSDAGWTVTSWTASGC